MNKYGGIDTIYMVGDVFKNKLNIQSSEKLEIAERELSALRAESLLLQPLPQQFDLSYLQLIHQDLDKQIFSERAAYYLGELNVLHPFRDGNGRTLRFFITQLARQNGWQIRWQHISSEEIVNACIEAYHGKSNILAILILKHLDNW